MWSGCSSGREGPWGEAQARGLVSAHRKLPVKWCELRRSLQLQ